MVVLMAVVVVGGYAGYLLLPAAPPQTPAHAPLPDEQPEPPAEVSRATGTTDDGWQQVTYRGVKLEVPAQWARLDASECEGQWERWGAARIDPCGDLGLVFHSSSSFESGAGPGVHEAAPSAALPDGGWEGY